MNSLSIIEHKVIAEGKVAELFYHLSQVDDEIQEGILKDVGRRIENLKSSH